MSYLRLSFAKRKFIVNKTKILAILVLVLLMFALDLFSFLPWSLQRLTLLKFTIIDLIFIPPILGLFIWVLLKVWGWCEKRMDAKIDEYHQAWKNAERGFKGEDLVNVELQKLLNPNEYHIFRNLVLKGRKSDMDFVIVGPKGVVLLEVKNYHDSKDSYTAKHQYYISKAKKSVEKDSDLREFVGWSAGQLEKYLAENDVDRVNVRRVILYVNPDSVEIKEFGGNYNRVYLIKGLNKLGDYLATCKDDIRFTSDLFTKVNSILRKI